MSQAKSPLLAFVHSASASAIALGTSVSKVPRAWPRRYLVLGAFLLFTILLLIAPDHPAVPSAVRELSSNVRPYVGLSGSDNLTHHPIETLHTEWVKKFDERVASQSRTLAKAVENYKKKYHRQPPKGFDVWYDFAMKHNYMMPDEFDTLMDTLEPYWKVSATELRTRLELSKGDGSLIQIAVQNGNATAEWADNTHVNKAVEWINRFNQTTLFSDFNLTINVLDEPRVNAALSEFDPATAQKHVKPVYDVDGIPEWPEPSTARQKIEWLELTHRHTWPYISQSCPEDVVPVRETFSTSNLPFLDKMPSHQDFCESVGMLDEHGFFQFPAPLDLTQTLVPVISQAAPTRFNDFLYPSPYYLGSARDPPNPHESEWNLKFNMLYWAGSTTGGHHIVEHWTDIQRAGLAVKVQPNNKLPVTLLQKSGRSDSYKPFKSTWSKISHYFYVHITNIVQCEEQACNEMKEAFDPVKGDPAEESQKYKYVLDIDGNSFSGRFYRLLKTKSAILKSTIFREWHDDVLSPWVHYIPVSTSNNELGEMLRFLATDMKGDEIGRDIAERGQEWAGKVLREIDLEIYFLRMMLEYNRVLSDERDTREAEFSL